MAQEIVMPKLGLTMKEGTIEQWFVQEGDTVEMDQVVAEISSEKLTSEVMAPAGGTILKIVHQEGQVVPATEAMAYIGEAGEDVGGNEGAEAEAPAAEVLDENPEADANTEKETEETPIKEKIPARQEEDRIFITPLARKMAEKEGIDISQVTGTGAHGRITRLDIERFDPVTDTVADQTSPAPAQQEYGQGLEGTRQIVAQRMMRSLETTAQLTHHSKVDITKLMAFRKDFKTKVDQPLDNGELSLNTLVTRAAVLALKEHPKVNSWYYQGEWIQNEEVHIGMATNIEEGLVVPVIRNADQMTLSQLGPKIKEVTTQAREGSLPGDLYSGSTFSITNLGGFGVEYFTPILNTPEVAILGVGDIQKELALDDEGQVVEKSKLPLSFTYDHQIIDGAPAAEFIQTVTALLEDPYRLVL